MDIPTGIVGLVGLLAFPSWLFAEYRTIHRLADRSRYPVIVTLTFAARGSQGSLYLHKQLLRAIDLELGQGEPSSGTPRSWHLRQHFRVNTRLREGVGLGSR